MHQRRVVVVLGLIAMLAVCAGCKVDTTVAVVAKPNGHGSVAVTVSFDRAAVSAIGGETALAGQLADTDLVASGWTVSRPYATTAGAVVITATHAFSSLTEAGALVADVAGQGPAASRPFRVTLTRHESFWHTVTSLGGTVDLTCGIDCFGDSSLASLLGNPNGVNVGSLSAAAGQTPTQVFSFRFVARLPGSLEHTNAASSRGGILSWTPVLGHTVDLSADSRSWNRTPLIGAAVLAGMIVVGGVGLGVWRWRRRRRRRPVGAHAKAGRR